jgi:hypothetical protein
MRLTRRLAVGLLAAGSCLAVEAQAQSPDIRLLGYNAALTATCNVGCTTLAISLALDGARPTDNLGLPVPSAIEALEKYLRNATFQVFGTNPTITGVSGLTGSFTSSIDNSASNFAAVVITDPIIPLTTNSVSFTLSLAAGGNVSSVSANGLAYVNPDLFFLNADASVQPVPPPLPSPPGGPFYQTGDFNVIVNASAVPEPSSIALFGTGLVGLVGAAIRRADQA